MNEERIFELLTNVHDKLSNIDSKVARIDERTLNLDTRISKLDREIDQSQENIVKLQNWQSRRDGNLTLRTKQLGWTVTVFVGLLGAFATLLTKTLGS